MLGRRLVEYMMSRKSETFLFESRFRRSILKSSSNIVSLFSLINFSERDLDIELTLLHTWVSIYASYFSESFWIISIKTDSSSLFYESLNMLLVYS